MVEPDDNCDLDSAYLLHSARGQPIRLYAKLLNIFIKFLKHIYQDLRTTLGQRKQEVKLLSSLLLQSNPWYVLLLGSHKKQYTMQWNYILL